jgi:hypothetical protein
MIELFSILLEIILHWSINANRTIKLFAMRGENKLAIALLHTTNPMFRLTEVKSYDK